MEAIDILQLQVEDDHIRKTDNPSYSPTVTIPSSCSDSIIVVSVYL